MPMLCTRQISCKTCPHRARNLFSRLSNSELEVVDRGKTVHKYDRGAIVCHEGTPSLAAYCIYSGWIQFYTIGVQGRSQGIRLEGPGQLAAYLGMLCDKPCVTSGKVVERATVCIIPRPTLMTLLESSAGFKQAMLRRTAADLVSSVQQTTSVAQETVRQRLARVIAEACHFPSRARAPQADLNVSLMRTELAEMAGTTPESCSRVLSKMADDRILALTRTGLMVQNLEALMRIADLEQSAPGPSLA